MLQKACRDQRVTGMQIAPHEQSGNVADCLSCTLAKSRRMSYKRLQPTRSLLCCEKLMTDVCHYGEKSVGGNVKFQLVEDEFSRYVWGFLLRHKSQSAGNLKTLILRLRQRGRHVRFIGSDQGTDFKNQELKVLMKENGIRPVRTNTYTPEENSLVEKMNGIMLREVRTLLVTTGLPTSLWGEAFKFAVTVYNFSPSKSIQGRSPYELYEGRKPNVSGLRVWGCAVTMIKLPEKRCFLDILNRQLVIVFSGRIVDSRDVKFREQWTIASDYVVQLFEKVFAHQSGVVLPATVPYVKLPLSDYTNSDSGDEVTSTSHISDYLGSVDDQQVGDDVVASEDTTENGDQQRDVNDDHQWQVTRKERKPSLVELRHLCRSKKTPSEPLRRSTRIRRPNTRLHGYSLASYFISTMDKLPKSVRAALANPNREKWLEAMEAEFQSIQSNKTWILVKRPPKTKVMTSRWVFVIKKNQHGEIERLLGIHSPVVSMEAIRVVIVLAFYYDLDLRQIDFTTAFLNDDMDVDVYMEQPELFDDGSGRVCLLKKSLYGLKQGPLIWNETLKKYLLKLGFKASIIGDGVYVTWIGDSPVFLTVYVDDVVIAAKTKHIE
ncbi:Integrase catalytic core protein [Phytophthora palmivora]|uniref:Integrase catalytic core protein n=1 Tax=Phytophthora palmivora TaxID=4796 RepID=A0A2P4YFX4_9STRA|nr:Integrase catalytic core protein [Phytophthora palmivora]